jgi:hypothetical protein
MNVRQALFPYGMDKQEDGSWVFFNREYKPVGMNTSEFVVYQDYPVSFHLKGFGPTKQAKLDIHGDGKGSRVYFYNDGSVPTDSPQNMTSYLRKLEVVMRLSVDEPRR